MARASNRMVIAMINMQAPLDDQDSLNPSSMGISISAGKPHITPGANAVYAQGVQVWKFDDHIVIKIEKDMRTVFEVMKLLEKRTAALASSNIDSTQRDEMFESEDLVEKITGVPPAIRIDFEGSADQRIYTIEAKVPFARLKDYLQVLNGRLQEVGGQLQSVDIAHAPLMTAHDLYQTPHLHHGWDKPNFFGRAVIAAENTLKRVLH